MSTITGNPTPAGVQTTDTLFDPLQLGRYSLRHRILMAPLTRSRARQPGNVPTSLMACYYSQRASAALIISEATQVSMQGQGYAWTPGIHSREQIEGWRLVTQAVHDADRVRVRLSPLSTFNEMSDDNPEETFGYVAGRLSEYQLAYLHLANPAMAALEKGTTPEPRAMRMINLIRGKHRGVLMLAGGFDHD